MTAATADRHTIRGWRRRLGVTQYEVADIVGKSQAVISAAETGRDTRHAAAIRDAILRLARNRRDARRLERRGGRLRAELEDAWNALPVEDAERLALAIEAIAWERLDSAACEEADGVGLTLPGDRYTELLEAFFDWPEERTPK